MYSNKLVASVKCGGKILREDGEVVYIPYSSEYSLLLKNLNTQKAVAHIEIDGTNVVPGGLIINPNQTIDLERFVIDGDMKRGPRFKFIEKTAQISEHRGDRVEDGLVRIRYQYEVIPCVWNYWRPPTWIYDVQYNHQVGPSVNDGGDQVYYSAVSGASLNSCTITSSVTRGISKSAPANDGITVHGSDSSQKFVEGHVGTLESQEYVMVLQLRGAVGERPVEVPVTVKRKIECSVCGTKNKTSTKFCRECGNNLTYQY